MIRSILFSGGLRGSNPGVPVHHHHHHHHPPPPHPHHHLPLHPPPPHHHYHPHPPHGVHPLSPQDLWLSVTRTRFTTTTTTTTTETTARTPAFFHPLHPSQVRTAANSSSILKDCKPFDCSVFRSLSNKKKTTRKEEKGERIHYGPWF